MKTNYLYISLVLLLGLVCSCSRQVTSLNSSSQLKTVSLPATKPVTVNQSYIHSEPNENPKNLTRTSGASTKTLVVAKLVALTRKPGINKILKKGTQTIVSLALKQSDNPILSQKYTTDKGYPQINKAGFIFIAAGILGYFLKLILVACIICAVIGLIVLISPLFRKRY